MIPLPTPATDAFLADSLSTLVHEVASGSFSVEELDYLGSALHAAVNRRRNSLLPVQDVPVEVLERIFEFVVAPLPLEEQMCARTPPQVGWALSLAQTCSQWRTIVLRSARIWYHVVDDSWRFLARPRDMNPNIPREVTCTSPLHVYVTVPPYLRPWNLSRDMRPYPSHMQVEPCRIQAVYLRIDKQNPPEVVYGALAIPLPEHVQLLALTSTRESARDDSWRYPRDLPVVFRGDTPNLRAFVADAYAPFLPGNAFPNLVNLRVSCLPHKVVGFKLLLELFKNTPRLETLELLLHPTRPRGYKEPMSVTDGTRNLDNWVTPVPLRRLRALTVSGLYLEVAMTLLSKMDIPSNVVMRLFKLQLAPDATVAIPVMPMVPALRDLRGLTHMDIFDGFRRGNGDQDRDDTEDEEELYPGRLGAALGPLHLLPRVGDLLVQPQPDRKVVRFAAPERKARLGLSDLRYSFYAIGRGQRSGLWIHVEAPWADAQSYVQAGILQSLQHELPLGDVTALRMSVAPDRFSCLPAMVSKMLPLTELVLRSASTLSSARAGAAVQDIYRALTPDIPDNSTAVTPAPSLEALTIELPSEYVLPTPLIDMAERRVINAVPLVSVTCNIPGAPQPELLRLSEHVIDDVDLTQRSLRWDPAEVLTPVWMTTNEYWAMHPRLSDTDAWELPSSL